MCSITMTKFTGCHCRYIHMSRQFCHNDNAGLCEGSDCMALKHFLDDICPDCQRMERQYLAAKKLNDDAKALKEREENSRFEQFRAKRNASAIKGRSSSFDGADISASNATDTILGCCGKELHGSEMPILTKVDTFAKREGSHNDTTLATIGSAVNPRRRSRIGAHNTTLNTPPQTPSLLRQDCSSSPLVAARLASMASMASKFGSSFSCSEDQDEMDCNVEMKDTTCESVHSHRTPCSSPTEVLSGGDENTKR